MSLSQLQLRCRDHNMIPWSVLTYMGMHGFGGLHHGVRFVFVEGVDAWLGLPFTCLFLPLLDLRQLTTVRSVVGEYLTIVTVQATLGVPVLRRALRPVTLPWAVPSDMSSLSTGETRPSRLLRR